MSTFWIQREPTASRKGYLGTKNVRLYCYDGLFPSQMNVKLLLEFQNPLDVVCTLAFAEHWLSFSFE